jgi:cytochrome c peroxidase
MIPIVRSTRSAAPGTRPAARSVGASWLLAATIGLAALAPSCSSAQGPSDARSETGRAQVESVGATREASTVDDLADQFTFFKQVFVDIGGHDADFELGAGYNPSLSTERLVANGLTASARIRLDMNAPSGLVTRIRATLDGFPLTGKFDLWFVKNVPNSSIRPEPADTLVDVGTFDVVDPVNGELSLDVSPPGGAGGAVYDFDLVVVSRTGQSPTKSRIVTGERTFFQKRFFRTAAGLPMDPVTGALANDVESTDPIVQRGAEIFFNETFGGNGRTCGTCHRRETNFTITPAFIATLPPTDPLFVAETNPALAALEDPTLLRTRALIRENTDGFGAPPVQRFSNHLFALGTSLNMTAQADRGYPASPPMHAIGRSADGAPGGSTLHEFLLGAITQHFPKSLARVPGRDFRLPTQAEADAVEAFQLFIGRSHEIDTTALGFQDVSAQRGQALANSGQTGKCVICHASLFGIKDFFENFNQGANQRVTDLPFDDGFRQPLTNAIPQSFPNTETPGAQLFNVPPLVEVADLGGFFHNNAVHTIEDAVAHYTSAAFANSPGATLVGGINLAAADVDDIANFLRELNALENIRQVRKRLQFVQGVRSSGNTAILTFALADANDAARDLAEKALNLAARNDLANVTQTLSITIAQPDEARPAFLANALVYLDLAEAAILVANPNGEFLVH